MKTAAVLMIALSLGAQAATVALPGDDLAREVAEHHGIADWDSVETLRWTFNVEFPDVSVAREWEWEPASGQVTLLSGGGDDIETPFTFNHHTVGSDSSEEVRTADARFINDSYWLLFPFHLVWDDNVILTDEGMQPLPIGEGEARRLSITYGIVGGYTPGDTYHLYLDDARNVLQWTHSASGRSSGSSFTWLDQRQLGPLVIYLDHQRDGNSESHVYVTDVSAVVDGETVEAGERE